jgi:hypothetical protein
MKLQIFTTIFLSLLLFVSVVLFKYGDVSKYNSKQCGESGEVMRVRITTAKKTTRNYPTPYKDFSILEFLFFPATSLCRENEEGENN